MQGCVPQHTEKSGQHAGSVLSSHHGDPGSQTQVVSLGDKCLYPESSRWPWWPPMYLTWILLLFLPQVVFVILAFLTGVLCSFPDPSEDKCPENYTNPLKVQTVIILGKVILWILNLLLERYIQYLHSKVRSRGYSQIYRSTRHLKNLALTIHSSGKPCISRLLFSLSAKGDKKKMWN